MKKLILFSIGIMLCSCAPVWSQVKAKNNTVTVTIQGKQYQIAETEEAWDSIMKKLHNMPFNTNLLSDWNTIYYQVDGCVAESAIYHMAELYISHPQDILNWIVSHPMKDNFVEGVVFGGGECIVGFPTRKRVRQDINKIKDEAVRKKLKKLLSEWSDC